MPKHLGHAGAEVAFSSSPALAQPSQPVGSCRLKKHQQNFNEALASPGKKSGLCKKDSAESEEMSLGEIRGEKGSSRAGFPKPRGMAGTVLPSRTVSWVGRGEKPQTRAGSQAGKY